MKNDDLKTILERLQKPLRYASQDDFARLKNLADLESFVLAQLQELRRLSADSSGIAAIEKLFIGVDGLPAEKKRSHILQAIAAIDASGHEDGVRRSPGTDARRKAIEETAILRQDTQVQYCRGVGPKRALLTTPMTISWEGSPSRRCRAPRSTSGPIINDMV